MSMPLNMKIMAGRLQLHHVAAQQKLHIRHTHTHTHRVQGSIKKQPGCQMMKMHTKGRSWVLGGRNPCKGGSGTAVPPETSPGQQRHGPSASICFGAVLASPYTPYPVYHCLG